MKTDGITNSTRLSPVDKNRVRQDIGVTLDNAQLRIAVGHNTGTTEQDGDRNVTREED